MAPRSTKKADQAGSKSKSAPDSLPATPDRDGARSQSRKGGSPSPERPRLTEAQKKDNHIASEKKRRLAIRAGFDRLTELVPGIEGQARSEGIVLDKTVEYMREQIKDRDGRIEDLADRGYKIDRNRDIREQLIEMGLLDESHPVKYPKAQSSESSTDPATGQEVATGSVKKK